jgi:hypothetical protein
MRKYLAFFALLICGALEAKQSQVPPTPLWFADLAREDGAVLILETNASATTLTVAEVCQTPAEGMSIVHGSATIDIDLRSGNVRLINVVWPPLGFHC